MASAQCAEHVVNRQSRHVGMGLPCGGRCGQAVGAGQIIATEGGQRGMKRRQAVALNRRHAGQRGSVHRRQQQHAVHLGKFAQQGAMQRQPWIAGVVCIGGSLCIIRLVAASGRHGAGRADTGRRLAVASVRGPAQSLRCQCVPLQIVTVRRQGTGPAQAQHAGRGAPGRAVAQTEQTERVELLVVQVLTGLDDRRAQRELGAGRVRSRGTTGHG